MLLDEIARSVSGGQAVQTSRLVEQALADGLEPGSVLNDGLMAGLTVIGERFKRNDCYIPEVLLAAKAMHAGMSLLRPLLAGGGERLRDKIVLGTVESDIHDIGKNLVGMMLEGAGYRVIDLGVNVPAGRFLAALEEHAAPVLAMSALLSTTMPRLQATIAELEKAGVRERVKVLVGGAPVTREYAQRIGADGYAPEAASAVDLVLDLLAPAPTV